MVTDIVDRADPRHLIPSFQVFGHALRLLRTDCMFSVTHVDVTRDLRYAKVYVSVYEEDKRHDFMKALKSAAGFIRHEVGQKVQLRYTPEMLFELDTSIEYGVHIASLINKVISEEGKQDEGEHTVP